MACGTRAGSAAILAAALAVAACVGGGTMLLPTSERYEFSNRPDFVAASAQAQALLAEHRDAEALEWLLRAVSAAPDHVPTHLQLQRTAERVGGEAEAEMRRHYQDLPDDGSSPVPPYVRARLAEDDHSRLQLLDEAIARDPSFFYAYLSKARLLRRIGRLDDARDQLQLALAARPRHPETNLELGEVLAERGQFAEAEAYYYNYVTARPEDRLAAHTYAQLLLYRLDKPALARTVLMRLREDDDEDAAVLMDLAGAAWKLGEHPQAVELYHRVLQLDRTATRAVLNLGNLFYDLGDRASGVQREAAWSKARAAYHYFLTAGRSQGVVVGLERMFAVPLRLDRIEDELGIYSGAVPTPGVDF